MQARRDRARFAPLWIRGEVSFKASRYRLSQLPFDWHWQNEVELHLCLRGRGTMHVGDHVGPFGPGALALIGPGLPHAWRGPADDGPFDLCVLRFSADWFEKFRVNAVELLPIAEWLRQSKHGFTFHGPIVEKTSRAMAALLEMPLRNPRRLHAFLGVLIDLVESGAAARRALSANPPPVRPESERLGQVLKYVHSHEGEEVSGLWVAKRLGITASAFSRWFHRHYGQHYKDFLTRLLIGRACRELSQGTDPILAIAARAGFDSLATFNRQFRRIHGMTPTDYRRAAR